MPRHFARRMYGPYFPYDHMPHRCEKNKKCEICKKRQSIWKKKKNRRREEEKEERKKTKKKKYRGSPP